MLRINSRAIILIDQLVLSGSNFIINIILARFLGIESFGVFSLLWITMLFFLSVQQAAIIAPMYSIEGQNNFDKKSIFQVNFFQIILTLISTFFLILFLSIFSFFSNVIDIGFNLIPAIIFCSIYLLHDYARRVLFLAKKYIQALIIDLIAYFGFLIVLLTVNKEILNSYNIFLIPIFTFFLAILYYLKTTKFYFVNKNKKKFNEYWEFSKWLSLSNILQWVSGNLFVLVGTFTIGPWVAGIIRIFQNLLGVMSVIFHALENFIPIEAAKLYSSNGLKIMKKFLITVFGKGVLFLIILIFSVRFLRPDFIIEKIYGTQYADYGYLLYIYLVVYFFIFSNLLLRYFLRTLKNTKVIFNSYVVSFMLCSIIAWPLVESYKMDGIVLGTLFSQISIFMYLLSKSLKYD